MIGGDAFYCAASLDTITKLAAEGIPVVGHVGLIPARATWTGGFKAVGKTVAEALKVYEHVKPLEAAGAIGGRNRGRAGAGRERDLKAHVALSYVDGRGSRLRRAISVRRGRARLSPAAISLVTPRSIATSAPNYDRLQRERIAAFEEFRADVELAAFREKKHLVPIAEAEFAAFLKALE